MARPYSATPLAALAAKAGAAAFARYGFAEAALFARWTEIVGAALGRMSLPVKLSFPRGEKCKGTLRIMAEGGAALELQHLTPQILERINGAFGYPAVAQISIVQGPVARPRAALPPSRPLSPAEEAELEAELAAIQDPALRQSFARLGRALYRENRR
jgi:hypothetical protein